MFAGLRKITWLPGPARTPGGRQTCLSPYPPRDGHQEEKLVWRHGNKTLSPGSTPDPTNRLEQAWAKHGLCKYVFGDFLNTDYSPN